MSASVRFAEALSIILVTFSYTVQSTLSEAVAVNTSSVQIVMKRFAHVTVLAHHIVFAVTLASGEGKTDTRNNVDNTTGITAAFLTVGKVEGVGDTLIALAPSDVVQTHALSVDGVAGGSLGSEHVAGALQAVGVAVVADGAFVAVVTLVVGFALASTGSGVTLTAGRAGLGALALLADWETKVAWFAIVTASSSVFLSAETFSSVDITDIVGGSGVTTGASLAQRVVEVSRGALFTLGASKTFHAGTGTTVRVTHVGSDSFTTTFANSAVREIEESWCAFIAVFASKVVFAWAGITKWQTYFIESSVVVAIAGSTFREVVVSRSATIATVSGVLWFAVTTTGVGFTCAQGKLAVAFTRDASLMFALVVRSPVPIGAQFAVDTGSVVLAVLTDTTTLVVTRKVEGQSSAGHILVVNALGGVSEAVASFTFVE